MSRDANGNYTLPAGNPVVSGSLITSAWANDTMPDLGQEITGSLSREGKGAMVAPLKIVDESGATPGLAFNDEPTSGLRREAAGDLRLVSIGTDIARTNPDSKSFEGWVESRSRFASATPLAIVYMADYPFSGDASDALQAACDDAVGRLLVLEPGVDYPCTKQIHMKGDVRGFGNTLSFTSTDKINGLVFQDSEGSLTGFIIDGAGATDTVRGLSVNTDFVQTRTCYYDLTIRNITTISTDQQDCTGALFYKNSSASVNLESDLDIRLQVTNVLANGDGVPGTARGVATGILVGISAPGTNNRVVIHDSKVDGVSSGGTLPAEDSDGIQILQSDYQTDGAQGLYAIRDCEALACRKRGVKVQSVNTVVEHVVVEASDTLVGVDCYGINNTVRDCQVLNPSGASYYGNFKGYNLIDSVSTGGTSTGSAVVLLPNTEDAVVRNLRIDTTGVYPSDDTGVVQIECNTTVDIDTLNIIADNGETGAAIRVTGTSLTIDLTLNNVKSEGTARGLHLGSCSGKASLGGGSNLSVKDRGTYRVGNSSMPLRIRDTEITCTSSSGIGVYGYHSNGASSHVVDMMGCEININADGNGVFSGKGSKTSGNRIASADGTGFGIQLFDGSRADNNVVTGFDYAVAARFTTTAEVSNNSSIGATSGVLDDTGSTFLINNDNYAR